MTVLAPCKAGDVGDVRTVTLGGVASLAGATAVAYVRPQYQDESVTESLTATITDPDARTVEVSLGVEGEWLPSRPLSGVWAIEIEVTFADDSVLTFPNTGYDTIQVIDDLD